MFVCYDNGRHNVRGCTDYRVNLKVVSSRKSRAVLRTEMTVEALHTETSRIHGEFGFQRLEWKGRAGNQFLQDGVSDSRSSTLKMEL